MRAQKTLQLLVKQKFLFQLFDNKSDVTKRLRIYISGPYASDSEVQVARNVMKAIDAALIVKRKGHYPYIPHLTHFVDLRAEEKGVKLTREDYMEWGIIWLEVCDALLFLGDSKGARKELEYAKKLKKIIYYGLDEVPSIGEC